MADTRDILIRLLGEETVSKMAGRAGDGLDKFGDKLDATEKDAKDLDRQIGEVEGNLKALAVAFARTTDEADKVDITRAIRKQQGELRKLTKAKDLLPDFGKAGAEAASGFSLSFMQKIGPLMARVPVAGSLGPVGAVIAAPIAVGAAATIGAAIAGAVVGGAGIGGVVGGLMLAAKDPRVQQAGAEVGADLSEMLGRASAAFVPETLTAIETVRVHVLGLEPQFRRAFNASARYVQPLTRGLLEAGEEALPGFIEALESAGPIVDEIADGIVGIGRAVGQSFSDLSEHADEGARALHVLFQVIEFGIGAVSDTIERLSTLFGLLDKYGGVIWHQVTGYNELSGATDKAGEKSNTFTEILNRLKGGASGAASETTRLKNALVEMNDVTLNAHDAERSFQAAVDDAKKVFDGKVSSLNLGTEKGRAYSEALDNIARTAKNAAQATYDQTGSTTAANAKIEEGRIALYKQARQFGLSKEEAWKYVNQVLSIPKEWTTKVNAETREAAAAVTTFQKQVKNLKGKTVNITVRVTSKGDHYIPGVGTQLKGLSAGGMVTGPGPKGVDSQVRMLAPGEGVLTAGEVDSLGGPAGFERLRAAIRGGGGGVGATAPAMAGAATVNRTVIELRSGGSRLDDLLVEILRRAISDRGGNVQAVLGR